MLYKRKGNLSHALADLDQAIRDTARD